MDRSWRPRPIQGNNCPTCLISHFPFCSPHPQFHQNPRFQSHDDLTFQRPHFDPFLDHRGPTPGLHPPFIGNPNDGFGDPRPWHRNPSLERESFGQFHGQSQIVDSHRYDHGDTGFKRMRVDENGIGSFTIDSYMNVPRISVENERRLKLIRDHGGVTSESKGYDQESSDFGRSFGNTDFGGHGNYGELRGSGNDMALENPISFKLNNFGDQDFDNFGRKEDRGLASAPHYMSSSEKEELGRLRFESSLNPSLQIDVRKGLPVGGPPIVKQGGQGEDMDLFYNEGGAPYKSNLGEVYSSHIPKSDLNQLTQMSQFRSGSYPTSEVPSDNYYNRNLDFLPLKETQHPHPLSGSSAPYHEQRSNFPMENQNPMQQLKYDFRSAGQLSGMRQSFEVNFPPPDRNQGRIGHNKFSSLSKYGNNMGPEHMGPMEPSRAFNVRPPLPASPPPPLPADPHGSSSPPRTSSSLFPIHLSSSDTGSSSYPPVPDHSLAHPSSHNKLHLRASVGVATEESQVIPSISSKKYLGQRRQFPPRHLSLDKTKVVDASHIFNQPHRAQRPDHIVIILRGLPGSGKSYLAKMLRDIEVENGGDAPRIHSMDEYFMTEVEKVEENEVSKSSASGRGKKPVTKKVMEYCYEPEMEEAYRSSMLKAFKKTLEEGVFSFIIVDDRNLRVADFAQFWAIAKRSGYEVYLLEATYKDPAGCAARNVHGFSQDDIERMARHWEEAPSLYLKLDIKSLFHGDDLKESGIQEVDMDTEDGGSDGGLSGFEERNPDKTMVPPGGDNASDGSSKHENGRNADIDHPIEVKELGSSKWSADFDDDDDQRTEASKGNLSSLSGLIQAYGKEGKSVHWGDQVGNSGFSIGAAKTASALSLVIGPGIGYNLKSNPLSEDVNQTTQNSVESKGQSKFQERLRAERESFKAVFDKRRQRISGFYLEDE